MVYLHGGGWAFGSPASFRKLGMQFAEAGYLTIVLDYRLAPEHPFPAAHEDTLFAVGWARDNARRWNGDGARIAIGGDSAGGNLLLSALASSELRAVLRGEAVQIAGPSGVSADERTLRWHEVAGVTADVGFTRESGQIADMRERALHRALPKSR